MYTCQLIGACFVYYSGPRFYTANMHSPCVQLKYVRDVYNKLVVVSR